jgi:hypothetical protein
MIASTVMWYLLYSLTRQLLSVLALALAPLLTPENAAAWAARTELTLTVLPYVV